MIVAQQKPLEEIQRMIAPYSRVLILGCGTCVTVCGVGGEREVSYLKKALEVAESRGGVESHRFSSFTLKRQCDPEFLDLLRERLDEVDAILSLACGVGVQAVVEKFPDLPVFPGVNTAFLGMAKEGRIWDERCAACGNCLLGQTAGICPITRCAKGILNGPCGGPKGGNCEVDGGRDCAWILIYERLRRLGQLEAMRKFYPPRNFERAKTIAMV